MLEIKKLIHYDRIAIKIFNTQSNSFSYFADTEGVQIEGGSGESSRPSSKGSVAHLLIESRKPVIIKDISKKTQIARAKAMWKAGLKSMIAFPLIIRDEIIGTIHFSFKRLPPNINELFGFLEELSGQISIAIDNMLSHSKLKDLNEKLGNEKRYLLKSLNNYDSKFLYVNQRVAELMRVVKLAAESDSSILITGETGTGKDLIARHIHAISSRKDRLFVKVNCAALAPTLLESELFGHIKGSFTGANSKRIGRFETADGGTILLDEIGDLPTESQAKLLQVLEEKTFERVGESTSITVNFRIMSSTNQNLQIETRNKSFRRDLYYRINTIHINIPPLRDRIEDIPLLLGHFTNQFAEMMKKPKVQYTPSVIDELCRYPWPGNVRELKNLVERIMILRSGHQITKADISHLLQSSETIELTGRSKFLTRDEMEKEHIETALKRCAGIVGGRLGAAHLLGTPRSTLQYRMNKLGINSNLIREPNAHIF